MEASYKKKTKLLLTHELAAVQIAEKEKRKEKVMVLDDKRCWHHFHQKMGLHYTNVTVTEVNNIGICIEKRLIKASKLH